MTKKKKIMTTSDSATEWGEAIISALTHMQAENIDLGQELKSARKRKGYSVKYVCEQLEGLGITIAPSTLYGYENNQRIPDIMTYSFLQVIYEDDPKDSRDEDGSKDFPHESSGTWMPLPSTDYIEELHWGEARGTFRLLHERPKLRELLSVAKDCTDKEIEIVIKIFEAIREEN